MANLQIMKKLRPRVTLRNPQTARPTATRLLACVWFSFHGYAFLLEATSGQQGLAFHSASAQEAVGSNSDKKETRNSDQKQTGNGLVNPNPESPASEANPGNETNVLDGADTPEGPNAQEGPAALEGPSDLGGPGTPKQAPGIAEPTLTPEQQMQIDSLIEQLSAPKFSQRESAATGLLQIGVPALASLRKQLELSAEKEAQIRITELIKQLIDGQIEVQIEDFMAMKPVNFPGWPEIRLILGNDTIATRALFVEIMRSHPTLPAAMQRNFTNRDRSIALESVVEALQKTRFKQAATTADAFALVLPHIYPDFVMPDGCEDLVISVWQSNTATNLRKDTQLAPSFRYLLGQWMIQTSLANREDVLFYGMDWDMPQCQILAKNTILNEKDASTDALAYCLQAMAKFGNRGDVATISTLLTDKRPVSRPLVTPRGTISNQVSDLAIAAIACIYGVELEDVGFTGVTRDPRHGFQPREIGFLNDAPEERAAAEKMIKAILQASPPITPQQRIPPLAPGIGN